MAKSPFGFCGLYCARCEIYIASTSSDLKQKAVLAEQLSEIQGKNIAPDDIHCWGCWANNRNCWGKRCHFRKCASDKGIDFCYQCQEFPCEKLVDFYEKHPEARDNLTHISKKGLEAFFAELMTKEEDEN